MVGLLWLVCLPFLYRILGYPLYFNVICRNNVHGIPNMLNEVKWVTNIIIFSLQESLKVPKPRLSQPPYIFCQWWIIIFLYKLWHNCVLFSDITCEICDRSCGTCNGGGVDNCLSCKPGFYMNKSLFKSLFLLSDVHSSMRSQQEKPNPL